jgi:hypothetical protein
MNTLAKFVSSISGLAIACAALLLAPIARATPYASGITNIGGKIQFIMNEAGATVNVVFEDHSTNAMGVLPKGATNFSLGAHTSYQIICTKIGNGTPVQISSDANALNGYNSPRGVDVNKNPTNGYLFGRIYIGNSSANSTRQRGIYGLTPDMATNVFFPNSPTNAETATTSASGQWGPAFAAGSTSGPYRMTVAPDNSLYVSDFSTAGGTVWQFGPNFEFTNLVLFPVGENQGIAAGIHGDPTGVFIKGSLATSNLTVYTSDPGLGAPATAQLGIGGEGPTSPGNYNNLFRYDIGAGNFVVTGAAVHAGGGGTGYSTNDLLAISGGTGNTATAVVTSVSSGVITGLAITNGGLYTVAPATPNSPTGGTGTNALIDLTFSGPLPWRSPPNLATCLGLPGFFDSQNPEITVETNGNMVGAFRRLNFSDGNIQVFDPNGNIIYTSLKVDSSGNPSDAFFNSYGGVRISPDNRWLATLLINDTILIANLKPDGTPDESSIFSIPNTPNVANARGLAWDAADNLYACSSGQGLLRVFSLGLPTTAITSNDFTGTNGSFQLILPPVTATIAATTPEASQNYVNNTNNPGTPTPGVFTISLNQSTISTPVSVAFTLGGSAANPLNYTLGTGTNTNGVIITSSSVTFPAGTMPGGGDWSADVTVTPTATPVTGPTLTVVPRLSGGSNYLAGSPVSATVSIANTGPQFLFLSAAASGGTMTRSVPNDHAQFLVTRWGDTNGPNNSSIGINPSSYTITNITYGGTAVYPVDYTAQSQDLVVGSIPVNGTPGIVIHPGDVTITALVGNPVAHPTLTQAPTSVSIIINLGTNDVSAEGDTYSISNNPVTLTEFDNTTGPEVVIWSNPLTNALDSTNWTVTFASTNMGSFPVLPAVIPNYTNGESTVSNSSTNDFDVLFGNPVSADSVPQSPVMAANGWSTALRMTVNKHLGSAAGVNTFPASMVLNGNYALRFSMYLSLYDFARHQPNIQPVTAPREFAAFGINTLGTNCDWRLPTTITAGTGASPTNADGVWFAIDAGTLSQTPADFDGFASPALPNSGVAVDQVSTTQGGETGVFKNPPFVDDQLAAGGTPVNQWVDVSVEVTAQTNVNLFIDRSQILGAGTPAGNLSSIQTGGPWTNGLPMLGYLDPTGDISDNTAFVYYSNLRAVELSPYITAKPLSLIVTQGATVAFTSVANYGTAPITNVWSLSNTNAGSIIPLQTNTANATNITDILTVTNVSIGTNYFVVFSDSAGSVTSLVASLEVIQGPANATVNAGNNFTFTATPSAAVTVVLNNTYQWQFNGTNLTNNAHYSGVTTTGLTINNAQAADAGTYTLLVVNGLIGASGSASATLTVNAAAANNAVVSPAAQTVNWGSSASFTVSSAGSAPFTYQWQRGGSNLADGGNIVGSSTTKLTLTPVTGADAASYTVGVTNGLGGTLSSAGILTVRVPRPTFSKVGITNRNVTLSFSSTNSSDTTNAFILLSAPVVTGPYTSTPGTFTSNGTFQVTVPETGSNMFFRLQHVP